MPHAVLKIVPGVDTNKTPTLNEMSVSYSSLVRFIPDRSGYGLAQKVGGWTRYIAGSFSDTIRALWPWADLEYTKYLAIGGEGTVGVQVYRETDDALIDVTPTSIVTNIATTVQTTGSSAIQVVDTVTSTVATTTSLTATYTSIGLVGEDSTLTNSGTLAPLIVDGFTVSSITCVSNVVTLTTSITHNFLAGDSIRVYGVTNSAFDGTFTILDTPTSTTIRYSKTTSNATSSGGTVGIRLVAGTSTVLVKDRADNKQNGVYDVTTVGSASVAWVLTRNPTFTPYKGNTTFVQNGAVNKNRSYMADGAYFTGTPWNYTTQALPFKLAAGICTLPGQSTVRLYLTSLPNNNSYVLFPTVVNIGNVNITGPYDVGTIGNGYVTFDVSGTLRKISQATFDGGTSEITIQFSAPHDFYVGQQVYVDGVNSSAYNGSWAILSITSTTITCDYTGSGAPSASSYGGTVNPAIVFDGTTPEFDTVSGSRVVTVTLKNHGYPVGYTFNIPVSTSVGGLTLQGLYTISKVLTADTFEIVSTVPATSTANAYENGNNINAYFFCTNIPFGIDTNQTYGGGVYGEGFYGNGSTPRLADGTPITAIDWTLDNWGSILVACPEGGAIYYWQPVGTYIANLSYMPNAPVYNRGVFVAMPQRQAVAYGSSFGTVQDPLLVRWCDVEDFSVWDGTANNQAGSYRIPTGSRIVGGLQGPQQGLLWTDLDLWSMTYIGQPYIYGFNKIGANAGLIGKKAAGQMGGVIYWMGQKQFFKFSGAGVEVIQCPVWDQVFQNLYPGAEDKIRCAPNSQFNEITWYFPAVNCPEANPNGDIVYDNNQNGNGEVNAYVKYNVALNQWDYGYQSQYDQSLIVARTAWIDQSILGSPIGAATTNSATGGDLPPSNPNQFYIYQHETSNNGDDAAIPSSFTTGYASIAEGDRLTFIDQIWPDMKWGFVDQAKEATLKMTFYVTDYPGDVAKIFGPYEITQNTQYLSVRMRGRLISFKVSSDDLGSFWRLGAIRYRFQEDGKY